MPEFSDYSVEAYSLYAALGGAGHFSTAKEYYSQPAIWIQTVQIIERTMMETA